MRPPWNSINTGARDDTHDRVVGVGEALCGFARDKQSSVQGVVVISNVCLRHGLPSFQHVEARAYVKAESLVHWIRDVATFTLGVRAWHVGLALTTPSVRKLLYGSSPLHIL